jgi:hypothetical protein
MIHNYMVYMEKAFTAGPFRDRGDGYWRSMSGLVGRRCLDEWMK